mmetsp:Transcript_29479/g.61512  ORF Transcript_29479/g.61512 Transcript_29479/m.61512 type:complete len:269 (-) Transcript_29479:86-892(-)
MLDPSEPFQKGVVRRRLPKIRRHPHHHRRSVSFRKENNSNSASSSRTRANPWEIRGFFFVCNTPYCPLRRRWRRRRCRSRRCPPRCSRFLLLPPPRQQHPEQQHPHYRIPFRPSGRNQPRPNHPPDTTHSPNPHCTRMMPPLNIGRGCDDEHHRLRCLDFPHHYSTREDARTSSVHSKDAAIIADRQRQRNSNNPPPPRCHWDRRGRRRHPNLGYYCGRNNARDDDLHLDVPRWPHRNLRWIRDAVGSSWCYIIGLLGAESSVLDCTR